MSSILPLRSEPQTGRQEPRVVDLEGDDADAVFNALSSGTAREIISSLHGDPKTQSEIADAIDTSVQNVRYHLDKLEDAGLVEIVDTWYSSRGNEMKVYAPADGALIVSRDEGKATRLKAAISRLVGGIGVVALASLFVQALAGKLSTISLGVGSGAGDAAPSTRAERVGAPETVQEEAGATETGVDSGDAAREVTQTAANGDGDAAKTVTDTTTTAVEETGTETFGNGVEYLYRTNDSGLSGVNVTGEGANGTAVVVRESTRTVTTTVTDPGTTATAMDVATTTATATEGATAGGLPPGVAFFLGGASVLVVLVALWYWSSA